MDVKKKALGISLRLLRIAGALLLIYVSMVFYLALTERRNAFPRAITHKEAREAIAGKAKSITCSVEDGTVLEGWMLGNQGDPTLLYFPDADEDATQFLAEIQEMQGTALITFNYRGSGENKGTPSEETFELDARSILECARQANGEPAFLAGRGTGAIPAANLSGKEKKLILIDPVGSIADAVSGKYRLFYPKFLVRANTQISPETLDGARHHTILLADRKMFGDRNHRFINVFGQISTVERGQNTLRRTLSIAINE
ncbi:MAG: alpha/beta hydrolase [Fibrobacter sp.]|uniref:alpha/beta hydrolase n=1 Tax=Fibrobacter sp. TaxID=35828 RepID=UPI0025C32FD5|nr:alpha/beta hydrolase [Fibrobacter sp.]MBR4783951.1 alpha/beta hydrolase [Fibrobacter sp.]